MTLERVVHVSTFPSESRFTAGVGFPGKGRRVRNRSFYYQRLVAAASNCTTLFFCPQYRRATHSLWEMHMAASLFSSRSTRHCCCASLHHTRRKTDPLIAARINPVLIVTFALYISSEIFKTVYNDISIGFFVPFVMLVLSRKFPRDTNIECVF